MLSAGQTNGNVFASILGQTRNLSEFFARFASSFLPVGFFPLVGGGCSEPELGCGAYESRGPALDRSGKQLLHEHLITLIFIGEFAAAGGPRSSQWLFFMRQ